VERTAKNLSAGEVQELMKPCDRNIRKTLQLVELMVEIADAGDLAREDAGCGVLYGVLRDSAYKIKKLAEAERDAHKSKGWWREEEVQI
jgi:hypothetical protein